MPSKKYTTPIWKSRVYHIFNRGINRQVVFHTDSDKRWFLNRFKHYLGDYAEVLAYSILDNHYHFLIRINDDADLRSSFSRQFGNLILSYTHYYNAKYGHSGPVFHRCFKRLLVTQELYFMLMFWYIHNNPVKHELADHYSAYEFTSYKAIIDGNDVLVKPGVSQGPFESLAHYTEFHHHMYDERVLQDYAME